MGATQHRAAIEPLEDRRLFAVGSVSLVTPGGDPAPGWGSNGVVNVNTGHADTVPQAMIAPSGGGVIVAGITGDPTQQTGQVFLERLNVSGLADATFGTGGIVLTTLSNAGASVISAGQSSDGAVTLLVRVDNSVTSKAGTRTVIDQDVLVRYTSAGQLDRRFGRGGVLDLPTRTLSSAAAMAVSPDGRITLLGQSPLPQKAVRSRRAAPAGAVFIPKASQFEIVRFNGRGRLDHSFGRGGVVHRAVGFSDTPDSLALGADGSIAAAGSVFFTNAAPSAQTVVLRYNSRGKVDPLFGTGGIAIDNAGIGEGVAIGPGDEVLVAGVNPQGEFEVAQFTPGGQLDQGFGTAGVATVLPASGSPMLGRFAGLAVTSDGRITVAGDGVVVLAGQTIGIPPEAGLLARLNPDGTPESAFGSDGQVVVPLSSSNVVAMTDAMAVSPAEFRVYLADDVANADGTPGDVADVLAYTLPVYPVIP